MLNRSTLFYIALGIYTAIWVSVWVFNVPVPQALTATAIVTLIVLCLWFAFARIKTDQHAEHDFERDRRRSHSHAIGPDGRALVLGHAVRLEPSLAEDAEPTEPSIAPEAPAEPAPPRRAARQSKPRLMRDEDALTLVWDSETYITPLWGRAPREAFRDLYLYAQYARSLEETTAT